LNPKADPTESAGPVDGSGGNGEALTGGRLLARNAAWNLLTQCLPMAVALATMPWLIRGLGTDRFGVMTLSWMVLGYFSLFDLGLGRALTKMVAERLGRGRGDEVPALVWTSMALMTALGLAGTALVTAVTPWLVDDALRLGGALRGESKGAFYLMGVALPFVVGTAGLRGAMEAHQRFGAINVVRTVTSLYILLAPLAVLWFTTDLAVVVGVVCLGRIACWGAHVFICLRDIPGLRSGVALRADLVRPLLGYGGWMTAVNVINPLMVQMDRFLIGAMVSAAAVAYYTTPQELVTRAWFLSSAVLGVMFPAFATSYVTDRRRTGALFGRCLSQVGLILFPICAVAVGLSGEILTAWLGADFAEEGARVLQWLALGVFLNGLAQVPSAMIQGIGRPDLTFKVHLAELPPYLLAAWLLIRGRGIEGAAVAWTARTALDLLLYAGVARAVLPEGRPALRGLGLGLAAGLAGLAALALPLGLAYRAPALSAVLAVFGWVAWRRLLSPDERSLVACRLGRAVRRVRGGGGPPLADPLDALSRERPVVQRGL